MKQSRLMSMVEAITNVVVGYGVAVVTQILIFPIFGLLRTAVQKFATEVAGLSCCGQSKTLPL